MGDAPYSGPGHRSGLRGRMSQVEASRAENKRVGSFALAILKKSKKGRRSGFTTSCTSGADIEWLRVGKDLEQTASLPPLF